MTALSWYLLKAIICSGILTGYYWIALRNKIFHQWNRFYLLVAVILSLLLPLIRIDIWHQQEAANSEVIQLLATVTASDEKLSSGEASAFTISTENALQVLYLLVTFIMFIVFVIALVKISTLIRKNIVNRFQDIKLVETAAQNAPFSFFSYIFWNKQIDINSSAGQHIFKHELAHVREQHSLDKMFINLVLVFCWMNPFYWLIKKELSMIHEFIADSKAIEDRDLSAFSAMILKAAYPTRSFGFGNHFFYSPIKRRLLMLHKLQNPTVNYISRLLVLPILVFVFAAFTLKNKILHSNPVNKLDKKITVVIDAGHGGSDQGAISNGINEKDITLSLAKKIAELNKNQDLNIVLSRKSDITINPKDRVSLADQSNADLFISLHVNSSVATEKNKKGMEVYISSKRDDIKSQVLGSVLVQQLKSVYSTSEILRRRNAGVWVLDANKRPAAIVEIGYLTNKQDVEFFMDPNNQLSIAKSILASIEKYAAAAEENFKDIHPLPMDTLPSKNTNKEIVVQGYPISNNGNVKSVVGQPIDKNKEIIVQGYPISQAPRTGDSAYNKALVIIDGKESGSLGMNNGLKSIPADNIESVSVLKGEQAIKAYGDKGKNGVIIIVTKKGTSSTLAVKEDHPIVFTKAEHEPNFPGGENAWSGYVKGKFDQFKSAYQGSAIGQVTVKFIVDKDGNIKDAEAVEGKDSKIADLFLKIVKESPNWNPAVQNGHKVSCYVTKTFKI